MVRRSFAVMGLVAAALPWAMQAQAAEPPPAKPARIVSLDLCADQLMIDLVERGRIAAVTHLAGDASVSAIPERARGLPITHGAAEDVLRYDPDLVLAGPFGVSATVDLLRRLGKRVVVVPQPADLGGIAASVRSVANAVGEPERGEAMLADFERRLAELAPRTAFRPTAVIYQVGGSVSAPGTFASSALAAAGFRNLAADYRLSRGGQVPLESLLARPPDLLVLASTADEYRTALADNLRHPAIGLLRQRGASIELPWRLWLCGTPHVIEALERLAAARRRLEARAQ